ncbi:hypothetical protein MPER_12454 [Moniliophthora perniciosa FA553]|nr:hypothetical protein MPER_12454 [Moniliophthora perniciosa FA553]
MPSKLDSFLTPPRSWSRLCPLYRSRILVYGLYTALFISYICILRRRSESVGQGERSPAKTLYLLPTIILFILTTLGVIGQTIHRSLYVYLTFDGVRTKNLKPLIHYLQYDPRKTTGLAFITICVVFLNVTADYILVSDSSLSYDLELSKMDYNSSSRGIDWHQCSPVVGVVGTSMYTTGLRDTTIHKNKHLEILGNFLCGVFQIMSVIVNTFITTLTAGRVWWMYRQSDGNGRIYKSVLRIIIESGLIFPILTLVHIVTLQEMPYRNFSFEFSSISYQTAGIAPTLIVVRAQLGKTVETMHNHDDVVSEINFSSCPLPSNWSSDDDSRIVASVHSAKMQQAHERGSGNLE